MEPSKPIVEAVKEAGRVAVLAVIPVLIVALQENKFDWRIIAVTMAVAILRSIDKWMHETGKEDISRTNLVGGLTRF